MNLSFRSSSFTINTTDWVEEGSGDSLIYVSPIFDTTLELNIMRKIKIIINSVLADINNINTLQISFRASDTVFDESGSGVEPLWTKFSTINASTAEVDISDLGFFIRGRYQQVRVKVDDINILG